MHLPMKSKVTILFKQNRIGNKWRNSNVTTVRTADRATSYFRKRAKVKLVWRARGIRCDIMIVVLLAQQIPAFDSPCSSSRFQCTRTTVLTMPTLSPSVLRSNDTRNSSAVLCRAVPYSSHLRYLVLNPFSRVRAIPPSSALQ
jgi:hypothetical protein